MTTVAIAMCIHVLEWSIISAGLCTSICQCHQPNLYVNEAGLLLGMGKLNDYSSYSYVYMYWSGP